jgi:hypothetical protein
MKILFSFLFTSLVVESAAIKEDGIYTLSASNNIGETISTATLKVHGKTLGLRNCKI